MMTTTMVMMMTMMMTTTTMMVMMTMMMMMVVVDTLDVRRGFACQTCSRRWPWRWPFCRSAGRSTDTRRRAGCRGEGSRPCPRDSGSPPGGDQCRLQPSQQPQRQLNNYIKAEVCNEVNKLTRCQLYKYIKTEVCNVVSNLSHNCTVQWSCTKTKFLFLNTGLMRCSWCIYIL